jgi:hypothetical protein
MEHNQGKGSASYEDWMRFHIKKEAGGAGAGQDEQSELMAAIARGDKYKAMAAEAGYKVSGAADTAKAAD